MLATPELITSSPTTGSWVTVNNTTLNSAGATKALIKIRIEAAQTSTSTATINVSLRKTGSALAVGEQTIVASAKVAGDGTNPAWNNDTNTTWVELDSSNDFDYYVQESGSPLSTTYRFYLMGYAL